MKCDEFEEIGLDGGRDTSLSEAQRAAAAEHVNACARCGALQNSWQEVRKELRALAEETAAAQTPVRVEMRLQQEYWTRHHTLKVRRMAVAAAWGLAAAAVLAGAVSWVNWRNGQRKDTAVHVVPAEPTRESAAIVPDKTTPKSEAPAQSAPAARRGGAQKNATSGTLAADNGLSGFTLLPGALPVDNDYGEILRVRMQRAMLESFGLPVNEERAGEWIQVDLLVGNDGLPEAVRLSR